MKRERERDSTDLCVVFGGLRGGHESLPVDALRRLFAQGPEVDDIITF